MQNSKSSKLENFRLVAPLVLTPLYAPILSSLAHLHAEADFPLPMIRIAISAYNSPTTYIIQRYVHSIRRWNANGPI